MLDIVKSRLKVGNNFILRFLSKEKCIYLASTTSLRMAISITYILLLTKLQKSQIPEKGSAPIEKRYHNQVKRCQNSGYISAETCNSALRTGSDDITGFFRPSFLPIRWSTDLQTSQKVIRSITYHRLTYFV
jgi:hypothetical protein